MYLFICVSMYTYYILILWHSEKDLRSTIISYELTMAEDIHR